MIRKLAFLRQTVLFRLGNHGIHGNGGLPGGTVPDDEFALAAADGNHGVNGKDARLDGHGNGLAGDDAGGDFFHRVIRFRLNRPFAVNRFSQRVHHPAQQGAAHGHGKKASGTFDQIPFLQLGIIPQNHGANLMFFQVHRQPHHPAGELYHFIEHDAAQPFDLGDAVPHGTNDAHVFLTDGSRGFFYFCFEFLKYVAHGKNSLVNWKGCGPSQPGGRFWNARNRPSRRPLPGCGHPPAETVPPPSGSRGRRHIWPPVWPESGNAPLP